MFFILSIITGGTPHCPQRTGLGVVGGFEKRPVRN